MEFAFSTFLLIFFILYVFPPDICAGETDNRWSGAIYHGEYVSNHLGELFFGKNPDYIDEYLVTFILARRFHTTGENLHWEIETQFGSGYELPRHYEFNLVLVARWDYFPWDGLLDTSVAFGEGFSYASQIPPSERTQDPNAKFLNYLLSEVTFRIPAIHRWELFGRIHHRSGAAGSFSGVWGGSNVVGTGLRYKF